MNVTEILQFTDQLVFAQTGKHLDDLQETVIRGVWGGQTYEKIADECKRSESRIRDVGYKLWQILSKQLGEDVNKSNFCWTLERVINSPNFVGLVNSPITWCSNHPQEEANKTTSEVNQTNKALGHHDLTLAPKITYFYGRESELEILSGYLKNQNTRLISVLGLPGVGKTTLVKQWVDLNIQQFDIVIWKSIKMLQSLDSFLVEVLTDVNKEPAQSEKKLTQFFNFLRKQRCLIILDDVQELFAFGQFAGQYKTEYRDYKTLFTRTTEIEHQSSLMLISQEQCQEMLCLDEELYPVKCLELEGLNTTEVFKNQGLQSEESWPKLLDLYEGNPVYLKDIASLIKNIFLGNVTKFLAEESLILTEDMKSHLNEIFNRLSLIEQQIVLELSKSNQFLSREEIQQRLDLSSMDLINGIQSLNRRYLLKRQERERLLLSLSPVFKEYVRTCRQNLKL